MNRTIESRIRRLEAANSGLPLHLPLERWTEAQLIALLVPGRIQGMTDQQIVRLLGENS